MVKHRNVFGKAQRMPEGNDIGRLPNAKALGVRGGPSGHQNRIGYDLKSLIGEMVLRIPYGVPVLAIQVLRQVDLLAHDSAIGLVLAVNSIGKISEFHLVWLLLIRVQSSWHTPISLTACRLQLPIPYQIKTRLSLPGTFGKW